MKLYNRWTKEIVQSLNLAVMAIAITSLSGHLLGIVRMFQWGKQTAGMGINTAICLVLIAISLFLLAARDEDHRTR